ncbi:MAG: hypothetical protein JSW07_00890 [bacterium]|nr:MAG: hypothetical protein JSW07_00890 [bacterium]
MISIAFSPESNCLKVAFQSKTLFIRKSVLVKTAENQIFNFPIQFNGESLTVDLGEFGFYQEDLMVKDNEIIGIVKIEVTTDRPFLIQCPFEYKKSEIAPYLMIPGFLYGTNNLNGSDGKQPKFDYGGKIDPPNSPKFYIRSDRSANSSVIRIGDGYISMVAIDHVIKNVKVIQKDKWSPGHLYTGLLLDSSEKDVDIIGFQIGYENAPFRYSWRKETEVPEATEKCFGYIENQKGQLLTAKTLYVVGEAIDNTAYGKALQVYYSHYHQTPAKVGIRLNAIEDIGNSLVKYGYNVEDKYFNLTDDRDGQKIGDIAWTGGMQAAYPLLKAGLFIQNELFVRTAKEFIDNLCKYAMNSAAGLFFEEFRHGAWQVTGWWGVRKDCFDFGHHPLHSAYLNGQCAYYILKSYLLDGEDRKSWLSATETVLNTVLRTQRGDGAFGVFFNPENGDAVDYDGFQSCWFVPALALMYKITKQKRYLESAERAIDVYYSWHLKGELYNTPMDTHKAVDQEGNLAFIAACRELHELTYDEKYLKYGIVGLNWEFSWKFAYNSVFSNNPLRDLQWSSSGGSITSTHNPSIHQMGNLVAGDMYYFYQLTNDSYLKERLKDTCIWGLNAYNVYDGYLGFGKKGMTTEQFTYTDGVVLPWPHPWDGGIWEANLPWAGACILLSCAEDIPDEFFGE